MQKVSTRTILRQDAFSAIHCDACFSAEIRGCIYEKRLDYQINHGLFLPSASFSHSTKLPSLITPTLPYWIFSISVKCCLKCPIEPSSISMILDPADWHITYVIIFNNHDPYPISTLSTNLPHLIH